MQPLLQKILYVEDDPDIQAIATMVLESFGGYEVVACSSGQEALQAVQGFQPDFILLDVMMPGMDGPATLQQLRLLEMLRQVPVAFMTARVQPTDVAELHKLGAKGVIAKPFDPMTLADQVRQLWEA